MPLLAIVQIYEKKSLINLLFNNACDYHFGACRYAHGIVNRLHYTDEVAELGLELEMFVVAQVE